MATTATLLKAKPLIDAKIEEMSHQCLTLRDQGIIPCLKILMVGHDPASVVYTNNKKKFAEKIAADCEIIELKETIGEAEFLRVLAEQVDNPLVHGVMVQSPVPSHLKHIDLHTLIPPHKDVDGFHAENLGKLLLGELGDLFIPCTPKGIITLLDFYGYSVSGKHIVIIGRGAIVGRPLAALFLAKDATVTITHSKTVDLIEHTQKADIIVAAIGKARFLTAKYLSKDKKQIVIDVGINAISDNKICGDVDYEEVLPYVEAITPVPGGVGPLTILSLAQNLILAAQKSSK